LPQLHRQMIEVLGIKNAEKLVPTEDDEVPRDPITENMGFLKGEPTKAFMYQDQDAHIAAHTSFMKDPMIAQQIGQSPMAQQMGAAIQAHLAEHLAFSYRAKIEEQLGVPLPPPGEKLPENIEVQLSRLVAAASTQLLQLNMAKAQQAQAQQQAEDPMVQLQKAELQIKGQEAQTKAKKVDGDLAIKQAELRLKQDELAMKGGESPQMIAQRHQQEMAQQQAQMQMMQQKHQQELAQQQQTHQQGMAHGGQVHTQGVIQQNQAHRQKLTHAEQAAKQRAQQMAASKNEREGSK